MLIRSSIYSFCEYLQYNWLFNVQLIFWILFCTYKKNVAIQFHEKFKFFRLDWSFRTVYTGWLDWKLSKVNCSGSECGHFWPHVVKTKMCLTIGSFILMQVVFWVYEKNKWRNYLQFPTCFRGLVDRRVGCKAKGPRFKTYLGSIKKLNFYRNFTFFSTFSQNENSPYKTASPQTNFGLYNIGSEVPTFRAVLSPLKIPPLLEFRLALAWWWCFQFYS